MSDLVLTADEIASITHRKRPAEQLRDLTAMGIPAMRRFDNTICVLRADVTTLRATKVPVSIAPKRKSARQ